MTLKKKMLSVLALVMALMMLCNLPIVGFAQSESIFAEVRDEALQELKSEDASYNTSRLTLENVPQARAEKIALRLGAELHTVRENVFAFLELPEGVTAEDVYRDRANRDILSDLSLDPISTLAEHELSEGDALGWPEYNVNDTYYASKQTYFKYLNVGDVWNTTKGTFVNSDQKVVLAVIDTGIDIDHKDFFDANGKSVISPLSYSTAADKSVAEGGLSIIDDDYGHGTACAGEIAAQMNGIGTVGLAPDVELMVIKANITGTKNFAGTDIVEAMYYAIDNGAHVVSMSLGGDGTRPSEETALREAVSKNVIFVAAAGNNSSDKIHSPAHYPNCIGVGALAYNSWSIASFSNYGDNSDLMAPGSSVFLTNKGGGWGTSSGTSMACPLVAAAVALYIAQNGVTPYAQLKAILLASCTDLSVQDEDWNYGFGALDVEAFVFAEPHTLTFHHQDGYYNKTVITTVEGKAIQNIPAPTRNGYFFDGWFKDPDGLERIEEDELYANPFTKDTTLYAGWWQPSGKPSYSYAMQIDGTLKIVGFRGGDASLTLPTETGGRLITAIGDDVFSGNTALSSVEIPEGYTAIGKNAFAGCTALKEVSFPSTLETVDDAAFSGCTALLKVSFGENLNSIGDAAFYDCKALTEFAAGDGLTQLGEDAFNGCVALQSASIGNSLRAIEKNTFYRCAVLEQLVLPASVKAIGDYAFYSCSALREIAMHDEITSIGDGAFSNCTSLECLTVPEKITLIGQAAFYNLAALKELSYNAPVIEHIQGALFSGLGAKGEGVTVLFGAKVQSIPDHFFLSDMEDPDTLEIVPAHIKSVSFAEGSVCSSIGEYAFADCPMLCDIEIPQGVTAIGNGAFAGCTGLQRMQFNAALCADLAAENGVFADAGIDGEGFELTIGKAVKRIPAYLCNPSGEAPNVKLIALCVEEGSLCESIGKRAFKDVTTLRSAEIGTRVKTLEEYAFSGCSALQEIEIPGSVTEIGLAAFNGCSTLARVEIDRGLQKILASAFKDCTSLQSLTLPDSLTSIGYYAFGGCTSLSEIVIGTGLTTVSGMNVFENCTSLKKVTIRSGVLAEDLESYAVFGGLLRYAEVVLIPKVIQRVGRYVTEMPYYTEITRNGLTHAVYSTVSLDWTEQGVLCELIPCEQDGVTLMVCAQYGLENERKTPMHAAGDWSVVLEPTCTEAGEKQISCAACGVVLETAALDAEGHNYAETWSNDEAQHWHACSCGDKAELALHRWNGGTVTTEPTEQATGIKIYACTVCSAEKTEELAKLPATAPEGNGGNDQAENNDAENGDASPAVDERGSSAILIASIVVGAAVLIGTVVALIVVKKKKKA